MPEIDQNAAILFDMWRPLVLRGVQTGLPLVQHTAREKELENQLAALKQAFEDTVRDDNQALAATTCALERVSSLYREAASGEHNGQGRE